MRGQRGGQTCRHALSSGFQSVLALFGLRWRPSERHRELKASSNSSKPSPNMKRRPSLGRMSTGRPRSANALPRHRATPKLHKGSPCLSGARAESQSCLRPLTPQYGSPWGIGMVGRRIAAIVRSISRAMPRGGRGQARGAIRPTVRPAVQSIGQ